MAVIYILPNADIVGIAQRAGAEDYYYDNGRLVCRDIGQAELDAEFSLYDHDRYILEAAKANKKSELNAACETAIIAGFESSALGSPHLYQSDRDDQLNLEGMSNDGRDLPFKCRDADGVWDYRIHTAAQLKQVKQDGVDFKLTQLQQVQTKKNTVDNLMARTELPADDPDYLSADEARAEIENIKLGE